MFVRLYSLYETGGMYVDFSWFSNRALPRGLGRGVFFRSDCLPDHEGSTKSRAESSSLCAVSSVYIFREPRDEVIQVLCPTHSFSHPLTHENVRAKLTGPCLVHAWSLRLSMIFVYDSCLFYDNHI